MKLDSNHAVIQLNQVEFAYQNDTGKPLLTIPSWQVMTGERVLLIGESGSGKSTLLKLLSGLLVADSGSVLVNGQALETMNHRQRDQFRAKQTGYVAQHFNLIPYLSAIDNINLATYFTRTSKVNNSQRAASVLDELNIDEEHWHRPVSQLSTGQQQRVAIARAVTNKPPLLIADEPTSSLDQSNRDNFISTLMTTADSHQMTLIFVSHDLALSKHFSRVDLISNINMST